MNILITKKLAESLLEQVRAWGWNFDVVEALSISLIDVDALPIKADAWIISSRNSWSNVQKFIADAPDSIYCVGQWLKDEFNKSRMNIKVESFANIEALATQLKVQDFKTVLYFCADNHRGELDEILRDSGINITKVITHESKLTYPVLTKQYDAVLVFSPRSVESLLKNNHFTERTTFACIGKTTEKYLHEKRFSNIFCASYPDAELLLNEFHEHCLSINN